MNTTLQNKEFKSIFQNSLRLNTRSMSIKTLLSERNLKRINYTPYYQRNYVWDKAKQTFFIESIILGTEIPPLILFKSGAVIEVIDGRQRFETIKLFKENSFSLNFAGLNELKALRSKSFNKLPEMFRSVFLDSNIRVFEFEVINQPNLDEKIIDRIKKEIFRRYNTGITPLNREELDNAKYVDDSFSNMFKSEFKNNPDLFKRFNNCFFPKDNISNLENRSGLIAKYTDFIRRYSILKCFPITTYARGRKNEFIELLYDFTQTEIEDVNQYFIDFKSVLIKVLDISDEFSRDDALCNKLIYECILWALTILNDNKIALEFDLSVIREHYIANVDNYFEEGSHYYSNVKNRFEDTAKLFSKLTGFDFSSYIRNDNFKDKMNDLRQTEIAAQESINDLSILRKNKPNPISTPIDELRHDLKLTNYLLRPTYQRQEKISILKASSIIESILLGINLPPIFVFKRNCNVKEVVDGQQRLLAIIGFLGEQYMDENGELSYSKNNNFKLKNLKILTEFEGKNYSDLPEDYKELILDYDVELVIIEEGVNQNFDPIDLFIRLNYKPYPIKSNSFEMWNSIVKREVVQKVKEITCDTTINHWFFLRETPKGKPDRMLNEELVIILAYISYMNKLYTEKESVIGFFQRQDRITCRLKDKKGLSDFLTNELDTNETVKQEFINSIENTRSLIHSFGKLFGGDLSKDSLNKLLNVKGSTFYRRSLQDFYLIWLIIGNIPADKFISDKEVILDKIKSMLSKLKNTLDEEVDTNYMSIFIKELQDISLRYCNL